MRKLSILALVVMVFAGAAVAQKKASFAGTWKLDAERSNLGRTRVESITLTVAKTDKEITVTTETKLPTPTAVGAPVTPANAPPSVPPTSPSARPAGPPMPPNAGRPAPGMGMGMGGTRGSFGGDGTATYPLDGKERKSEVDGPMGKMPVTTKGTAEADGSLKLVNQRSFGQMSDITITTTETWKLSPDGSTLTIERVTKNPRGQQGQTLVFTRG